MKKILSFLLISCFLFSFAFAYELPKNTVGDDTAYSFYGNTWIAQTFTTCDNCDFQLNTIKLKMYQDFGNPGNTTASIRKIIVNQYGQEEFQGGDIVSVSFPGSLLTTSYSGSWINLSVPLTHLEASSRYAIVLRTTGTSQNQSVSWKAKLSGSYPFGQPGRSFDASSSWLIPSGNQDYMFELVGAINLSAEVLIDPYENQTLPQLSCNRTLKTTGLERTYLFCSWRIDGQGEEGISMTSQLCPSAEINYTFTGSETYAVSIDYANVYYNTNTLEWEVSETGNCAYLEKDYTLNIPEPDANWLQSIWQSIWNTLKLIWCNIFGGGFC